MYTLQTSPFFFSANNNPPSASSSRPSTREGLSQPQPQQPPSQLPPPPPIPAPPNTEPPPVPSSSATSQTLGTAAKDKKTAAAAASSSSASSRKSSFSVRRRGASSSGNTNTPFTANSSSSSVNLHADAVVTNSTAPPALPDYALSSAAKISTLPLRPTTSAGTTTLIHDSAGNTPTSPLGKTLSRTNTSGTAIGLGPGHMMSAAQLTMGSTGQAQQPWQSEMATLHAQITDLANKRISTLDYLRKSHEGRIYWFNTYLFDKPDLHRMPYFDHRKLARRATNFLLLGLSVPTISDLYTSTPIEFLRSLYTLLSEFDSFQQLHSDNASNRPRLQHMFRRPGGKSRRSTSASVDAFTQDDQSFTSNANSSFGSLGGGGGASSSFGAGGSSTVGGSGSGGESHNVINFAASESELFPGEEYSYLLTPSLPFDPDYYETFATLCDVMIEAYTKFLSLVPTPREYSTTVAELFGKVDGKVRKLLVQGVVKEFEEHSKTHARTEVANIGRVVLGGLM